MTSIRVPTILLIGVAAALVAVAGHAGNQNQPPKKPIAPKKPVNEIVQEFPTNGAMETAWKIHWATATGYGVCIQDAWYRRGPNDRWIQVLGDARISEIFVPYHRGSPRFWDVSYNFPLCEMTPTDAGPFGKLLRDRPDAAPTVVQEIRDRGLMWRGTLPGGGEKVRRGQTLVVWGCLRAANYRYIIEYGFQDDGVVTFRLGSTGRNYGGSEYEPHMHNGLWRIDVNLDGPENNSVYVVEHIEPASDLADEMSKAKTVQKPFNGGQEGWADWTAGRFTHLRVVNDRHRNKRGDPMAYDLMPIRMGNARHHGGKREECTHHDFWVTRARPDQIDYINLPKYVADREPVMKSDVILWHSAPMHHEPRLEDGKMQGDALRGITHVVWAGFVLKPRNLFDRTPLYPYNPVNPEKQGP
ncbi:MAG: hypothetical protein IT429_00045 [Gemmataceae bacterium]|nr:hypothetical protein [Gemmataceae bacterium]